MKATENRNTILVTIVFALVCFPFSPATRAQCQQGCLAYSNTVLGDRTLVNNSIGDSNTAIGAVALYSNTIGSGNTATGSYALYSNTIGSDNTATGFSALGVNTTGEANTATGSAALENNTTGSNNTAIGVVALYSNTEGGGNTASGRGALFGNTTGSENTATGHGALSSNTGGSFNTATGVQALLQNTTGSFNAATGVGALQSNTTGANNTAIGYQALINNNSSGNIAVGSGAGLNLTTGSNNIDIGNGGVSGESSTIRIGGVAQTKTFIKGISGVAVAGPPVRVNAAGQLGVAASSKRFKEEIKPMDQASKAILALKPVSFRYKKEIDPERIPQFGLVAEEVEKVNPDLVVRDKDGKPYTVRYDQVNAMLLNEFLKEHKKVEAQSRKINEQEATIAQLKKDFQTSVADQQKQIEAVTAGLQKVNAKVELKKPAPQTVLNQ